MSNGPYTSPVQFNMPSGKGVVWIATTQSGLPQTVTVTDAAQNTVISASGPGDGGQAPNIIGYGVFTSSNAGETYTVSIEANGQPSQIINDGLELGVGTTIMSGTWSFVSEDSSDNDFNDTSLTLTWFDKMG